MGGDRRKRLGLTLKQVAAEAGMHLSQLCRIEHGVKHHAGGGWRPKRSTEETLARVRAALDRLDAATRRQ